MNLNTKALVLLSLMTLMFSCIQAQVINIEAKRIKTDTVGLSGSLGANFNVNKFNESAVYNFDIRGHIQYKALRHIVLLLGNSDFVRAGKSDFINDGMMHLRYNYKVHSRISLEYFNQVQYNPLTKMQLRVLAGAGPRFKLSNAELYRLYFGTAYMYEFEEVQEQANPNRQHRSTSYLSFSLFPKNVSLINTTYFQVRFDAPSDHRIVSQNELAIDITTAIAFTVAFNLIYDSEPNEGVRDVQYEFTNGIRINFN